MEWVVQCLSPVHIGTGKKIEPFDYILDKDRYLRVNMDAFLERLDEEQANRLAEWVSERADQIALKEEQRRPEGEQRTRLGQEISQLRREMHLLSFARRESTALEQALRTDSTLALYQGRTGMERNLQVNEQVKDATGAPLIPGSSIKGAIRTALAFLALREMDDGEKRDLTRNLESALPEARKDQIGQVIEQAIFRCGRRNRFDDVHYDLLRALSVSDTLPEQTALIVPQIHTFVEGRTRDGGRTGQLQDQAPLIAEAHAPGNVFRLRLSVDAPLLLTIASRSWQGEWLDFEARVRRSFGQEVARRLPSARPKEVAQAVLARIETACRAFAQAVIEEEAQWCESFSVSPLRQFYEQLRTLDGRVVPLRLGWGSHFMATTLLLALRQEAGWREMLEQVFRRFSLDTRGRRGRNERTRAVNLDHFPRSRRLVSANRRPVAPLGWVALAPSADVLPGGLVDLDTLLMPAGRQEAGQRPVARQHVPAPRRQEPAAPPRQQRRPSGPGAMEVTLKSVEQRQEKPAQKFKQGDKVNVEIVSNDGRRVTVKVLENQGEVLSFSQSYYPGRPGDKKKMRVRAVDAQGRITQVAP